MLNTFNIWIEFLKKFVFQLLSWKILISNLLALQTPSWCIVHCIHHRGTWFRRVNMYRGGFWLRSQLRTKFYSQFDAFVKSIKNLHFPETNFKTVFGQVLYPYYRGVLRSPWKLMTGSRKYDWRSQKTLN